MVPETKLSEWGKPEQFKGITVVEILEAKRI
jgi:hypothetical protein